MIYKLTFLSAALKEWRKLDATIAAQFKSKLKERLNSPRVDSAKLSGFENMYQIKLRSAAYRFVYEVFDKKQVLLVLVVGKREGGRVYKMLSKRR